MRIRSLLAPLAAVSLLLTACGADSPSDDAEGGADSEDDSLVIAVGAEPGTLNPIFGDAYGTIYGDHWPIFSSLFRYDQNLDMMADLAAEVPELDDGTTVTVELREDATWHDGEPVTADDVVFTYESIMDTDVATSLRTLLFETLDSVEAEDDHTVTFELTETDPAFLEKLTTGIIPEHLLQDEDLNKGEFGLDPVGSGPFVFEEFRPGERMVMTANENYYGGDVGLERVVVRFIDDASARINEIEAGSVDVDADGQTPQAVERFKDDGEHEVVVIPGDLLTLTMPTTNPFFEEAEVRQAIGMAIDRQALLDGSSGGAGRVVDGPFFPGSWADDGKDDGAIYDPEKAAEMLADAGWEKGSDGMLERDGDTFAFDLIYGHGNVEDSTALAIRDQMAELGIDVNLEILGHAESVDRVAEGAVSLQSVGNAFDPARDTYHRFHSDLLDDDSGNNVAQIDNPEIDKAIEDGQATVDQEKRAEAYAELSELLREQASWQFLLQTDDHYVVPAAMDGIDPAVREGHVHGFSRGLLWNLEEWSWADQ